MFTPREIAKYAADYAVGCVAAQVIETTLVTHTSAEADDIPVRVTSAVGGWIIADALSDHTHNAVDYAASKIESFRNRKATK